MEILTENYTPPAALHEVLDIERAQGVNAGHMMYDKCLIDTTDGHHYFVKTSDDSLLTDPNQATKMWEYLIKEQYAYDIVRRYGYEHIPSAQLHERSLILEAHREEDGWLWEAPFEGSEHYVEEVLQALGKLSQIPAGNEINLLDPDTSNQRLLRGGWETINPERVTRILDKLAYDASEVHHEVWNGIDALRDILYPTSIEQVQQHMREYANQPTTSVAHFDARQSNIAWHPDHGVRIVDWSWMSAGQPKGDTTMFLIDLHKSHIPIDMYAQDFDPDYAMLQIGYWLARSIEPSPTPDNTVRFHQLASAITAADLLLRWA